VVDPFVELICIEEAHRTKCPMGFFKLSCESGCLLPQEQPAFCTQGPPWVNVRIRLPQVVNQALCAMIFLTNLLKILRLHSSGPTLASARAARSSGTDLA
jgi:hypothetical protein